MKVFIFESGHCFRQLSSQVPDFPAWSNCLMRMMYSLLGVPCSHPPKEVGWGPTSDTAPLGSLKADEVPLSSACGCCWSKAVLDCAVALGCAGICTRQMGLQLLPLNSNTAARGIFPQQIYCFKWFIQKMQRTKITFQYFDIREWLFNN